MLLTFISDVDYLPDAHLLLWNNNHAGLIVQDAEMIRCISPEGYGVPMSDVLGNLHDSSCFDQKTFWGIPVTCCDLHGLSAVVYKAYADVVQSDWRT